MKQQMFRIFRNENSRPVLFNVMKYYDRGAN